MSSKQQTALQQSIQRKREKVDRLYCASATHTSDRMRNIYKGMIRALKSEIAEDEKLLAEDREQRRIMFFQAYLTGAAAYVTLDVQEVEDAKEAAEYEFNQQYPEQHQRYEDKRK